MTSESTSCKPAGPPNTDGLRKILGPIIGSKAFIIELTGIDGRHIGNNGDKLMYKVFRKVLDELSIGTVSRPMEADVLILPPNGALLESYSFPDIFRSRLLKMPDIPLVLFPSSALFKHTDPSSMFQGRTAPTSWILREQRSYDHLVERWGRQLSRVGVDLLIDHDIVASGHKYVSDIIGHASGENQCGVLVSARGDKEASENALASRELGSARTLFRRAIELLFRMLYSPLETRLIQRIRLSRQHAAAVALLQHLPDPIRQRVTRNDHLVHNDISAVQYATFGQYCKTLSKSALVVTDRLHIALPAAVLGREVFMVEGGYHKLTGVYERSLRGMPNVTLVSKSR